MVMWAPDQTLLASTSIAAGSFRQSSATTAMQSILIPPTAIERTLATFDAAISRRHGRRPPKRYSLAPFAPMLRNSRPIRMPRHYPIDVDVDIVARPKIDLVVFVPVDADCPLNGDVASGQLLQSTSQG
jgi:hypothetical protein